MIRRPPRSTQGVSSAASDVYKRQAYTQSVFSGRRIEKLLHDSIRMMWLAQNQTPSYKTINRFRVNPNTDALI
ncbi:hypothetical protein JMUB7516_27350 [Staphylococcus aureus]